MPDPPAGRQRRRIRIGLNRLNEAPQVIHIPAGVRAVRVNVPQPPPLDPAYRIPIVELRDTLAESQSIIDHDKNNRIDEKFHCTICYDIVKQPVGCGSCVHRFCRACLQEWFLHHPPRKCPVCRASVNGELVVDHALIAQLSQMTGHCRHCHTELTLDTILQHFEQDCPHAMVRCKFRLYGCDWSGRRDEPHDCPLSQCQPLLELYRTLKVEHDQLQTTVQQRLALLEVQQLTALRNETRTSIWQYVWKAFTDPASVVEQAERMADRQRPRRVGMFQFMAHLPTFVLVCKLILQPMDLEPKQGQFLGPDYASHEVLFIKLVTVVFGVALFAPCVMDLPKLLTNALALESALSTWLAFLLQCVSCLVCVSIYDLVVTCYGPERSQTLWWAVSIGSWFPASVLWGMMSPPRRLDPQGKHMAVLWGLGVGWSLQYFSELQCLLSMFFLWSVLYLFGGRARSYWWGRMDTAVDQVMHIILLRELTIKLPFEEGRRSKSTIRFVSICLLFFGLFVYLDHFLHYQEAPLKEAALFSMQAGAVYSMLSMAGRSIGWFIKANVRRSNVTEAAHLLSYGVLIVWLGSLIKVMLV